MSKESPKNRKPLENKELLKGKAPHLIHVLMICYTIII